MGVGLWQVLGSALPALSSDLPAGTWALRLSCLLSHLWHLTELSLVTPGRATKPRRSPLPFRVRSIKDPHGHVTRSSSRMPCSDVTSILPGHFYIGIHSCIANDDFQVTLSLSPRGLQCPSVASLCEYERCAGVTSSRPEGHLASTGGQPQGQVS